MENWRVTRPADVVRTNDGVLFAALRAYLVLFAALRAYLVVFAVLLPSDAIGALLIAHHRLPTFSTVHVLSIALPMFLTGFLGHAALYLLGAMFLVAISSLMWWRHILAVGGPSAALAALASATRRVVLRLARRIDAGPLVLDRREETAHAAPEHPLLDQLRAALIIAPAAPPCRLTFLADRTVRTDQSILRRPV